MLIFKVISKWCTRRITTIDQKQRENILIGQWNSRKKVIPSHHPIKDLLISCGTLEVKHQVFVRWKVVRVHLVHQAVQEYVARWTEAKPANSIKPSPIQCPGILLYSKQSQSPMGYRIKFYSRKCTLNQKIWIIKQARFLTITDKSHSWEKSIGLWKQKEEEERGNQLFTLNIRTDEWTNH